jgi:DNA-binding IclR family transcriptional regulator
MKRERGSTIERVLDILDTVAASPKPLSATEINEVLNLPKSRCRTVINKLQLVPHAKNTIIDPEILLAEIDQIKKTQVSIDNEELYDDIIAIAVPITDRRGRFYSSLAIQAPVSRISIENSDRYVPLLFEAAGELSMLADG